MDDCLFCKFVNKDIPVDVFAENDFAISFKDINPQAPTHLLVVPKKHYKNLAEMKNDPENLAGIWQLAIEAAEKAGLGQDFRSVVNTGEKAGQTVLHTHIHVLGGRELQWPPG